MKPSLFFFFLFLSFILHAADLRKSLVAHWTFDEAGDSPVVKDVTGHGHDGMTNVSKDEKGTPSTVTLSHHRIA